MPDNRRASSDNKDMLMTEKVACLKFVSKDRCEEDRKEFWDGLNSLKEIQTKDHLLLHQLLEKDKYRVVDEKIQWEHRRKKFNRDNAMITTAVMALITAVSYFITLAASHYFGG